MASNDSTIYEVAELAGVSIATVSRVVNNTAQVRPATRNRVEAAMKQLKFVPSSAARGLSGGKNRAIGLAYPTYENQATFNTSQEEDDTILYIDTIIRGASARASQLGYSLFTCQAKSAFGRGLVPIQQLSNTIDGIILADGVMGSTEAARLGKRLPVVLLTGDGTAKYAATVRADSEAGVTAMVEHLVQKHQVKRFGYVGGIAKSPDAIARLATMRDVVKANKAQLLDVNILTADFSMMRAVEEVEKRLARSQVLPEVFVCANDQMALGVMQALSKHNLNVPGDILVTGFDDVPLSRMSNPPMTTVRQAGFNLGVTAVELAVGLIEGKVAKGTTVTLPTDLVVRRSCGCTSPTSRASSR